MPERQWTATRVVATFLQICAWTTGAIGLLIAVVFFIIAFIGLLNTGDRTFGAFGLAAAGYFGLLGFGALLGAAISLALLLAAADRLLLLIAIEENTRIAAYMPRQMAEMPSVPIIPRAGVPQYPITPAQPPTIP